LQTFPNVMKHSNVLIKDTQWHVLKWTPHDSWQLKLLIKWWQTMKKRKSP
jgi:hypothetical protein